MKNSLLILFTLLTLISKAQGDSTSIYFKALKHYNAYLDENKFDEPEIFIESNNGITQKLPKQVGNRLVKILTWENQSKIYKENNNNIRHVKIFPANIDGELVEIQFTPYFGEYRGKKKVIISVYQIGQLSNSNLIANRMSLNILIQKLVVFKDSTWNYNFK